jgi:DNA polymerase-3 subunit gamma/tau
MSNFVVSARKYRPARFEDVVGQEHVGQTLKNALKNDHLAHAFLFCGPRGVGKTTCARILAKVLNCQHVTEDFEPCNTCSSCQSFNENSSFNITELDAASNNSVEHIRALIEQVRFQPQQGKYKVFIIDEVHMLSQQAFNAFLKTLEEPPSYAIFILATTEKHKIIPTILSRCQIFDFKRIQVPSMVAHLEGICKAEGIKADKDALHIIAQKADGALRDSLSIFDRIVSFSGDTIKYEDVISNLNILDYDYYFKVVDALLAEDMSAIMLLFDDILRKGFDGDLFINGLAEHLRNLLICKDVQTIGLLEVSEGLKARYQEQATLAPAALLLTALNLCNDCDINYKLARNKRLHVEMALLKMTYIQRAARPAATLPTTSAPEKKKGEGLTPTPLSNEGLNPTPSEEAEKLNEESPLQEQANHSPVEQDIIEDSTPSSEMVEEPVTPVSSPQASATNQQPTTDNQQPTTDSQQPTTNNQQPTTDNRPSEPQPPTDANGQHPKPETQHPKPKYSETSLDLNQLLAEVQATEQKEEAVEVVPLNSEKIVETWQAYIDQCEQESVKAILRAATPTVEEEEIKVLVGSTLAENVIREEQNNLMTYLCKTFNRQSLTLRVAIDPTKVMEAPKRKKPMTDREKFLKMAETNALIHDIRKRFDLRPDVD